jgi:hypothetical protein
MRDFLKKIFSGKTPEPVIIACESIPDRLRGKETEVRKTFTTTTEEPVRNIRNAAAQLQLIVNTITGAEHDPEIHPKLKSIAKNTLPQFIRSMNASLAKEFPDDPVEFYDASVECINSCLNSIRGPGRYLQIVFPQEMKAARTGIDAMGREINEINPALATYRIGIERVHEAQALYATLTGTKTDLQKAREKYQRTSQRIQEISERVAGIDQELRDLLADPQMSDVEAQKTALQDLEKRHEETARSYAAISMTTSHVLRKAEKIAIRQNHPAETTTLQHAMTILSDHELPDSTVLAAALAAACPITERMIESGDIALKNKEERAIFSDSSHFCSEICSVCERLTREEDACTIAHNAVNFHPMILKTHSLEREQAQLRTMLEKEKTALKELEDWQQKTIERIPVLTEELRKKVGIIEGKDVQFHDDNRKSA